MDDRLKDHARKEALKRIIDSSPNYTDQIKADIKIIIDAGRSPEEILEAVLAYFAMLRFF